MWPRPGCARPHRASRSPCGWWRRAAAAPRRSSPPHPGTAGAGSPWPTRSLRPRPVSIFRSWPRGSVPARRCSSTRSNCEADDLGHTAGLQAPERSAVNDKADGSELNLLLEDPQQRVGRRGFLRVAALLGAAGAAGGITGGFAGYLAGRASGSDDGQDPAAAGGVAGPRRRERTLNIYNWSDYIDEKTV